MTINQHTLASKMKDALKAKGGNEITVHGCEIFGPGVFDITYNTDDDMPSFYTYCEDMDTMGHGRKIWDAIEEMFCADDMIRDAFKENNEEITVPDSEFEKLKSLLNETFDCGDEVFDAAYECANILKFVMTNSDDGVIRSKAARLFGIKRGTQKPYPEAVEDADTVADYLYEQSYEEYAQDIWDAFAQCRQGSLKESEDNDGYVEEFKNILMRDFESSFVHFTDVHTSPEYKSFSIKFDETKFNSCRLDFIFDMKSNTLSVKIIVPLGYEDRYGDKLGKGSFTLDRSPEELAQIQENNVKAFMRNVYKVVYTWEKAPAGGGKYSEWTNYGKEEWRITNGKSFYNTNTDEFEHTFDGKYHLDCKWGPMQGQYGTFDTLEEAQTKANTVATEYNYSKIGITKK